MLVIMEKKLQKLLMIDQDVRILGELIGVRHALLCTGKLSFPHIALPSMKREVAIPLRVIEKKLDRQRQFVRCK